MEKIKMIDLPLEHQEYEDQLLPKITECLQQGAYINGAVVKYFSEQLAQFLKVKHCVPCGNGTDALQIALMALNLEKDDEILIPSFNYVSAAEAAVLLSLKPVFVDVDLDTFNISCNDLKKKINNKTKAIIVTHLFGQAADMNTIMSIATANDLFVIEDAAQSLGNKVLVENEWRFGGTIADIGTTSFFPTKNLGGLGDGGALFTNNDELAQKLKSIASHGQSEKYHFQLIGINSRLDSIQATALSIKLEYLEDRLSKRKAIAQRYLTELNSDNIILPTLARYSDHTFNQFTIQIEQRDQLKEDLIKEGIPSMIYYHKALHEQEAYINYNSGSLSNSELLGKRVLSLPIHPMLSEEQQTYIIDTLNKLT